MKQERRRGAPIARAIAAPFSALFRLVLGSGCALCYEQSDAAVCSECASTFQCLGSACCPKCGRPKFEPSAVEHPRSLNCGECEERRIDRAKRWHFDRAVSTFLYEGRMRKAILTFKYRKRFRIGDVLGELLARHLPPRLESYPTADNGTEPDVIIPVPLHISRLREREFNQSAILAKHVGEALNLPIQYESLERIRATEPQWTLSPRQKVENVRGAFKVMRPRAVKGARILLVDDIFTKGATANECAKALTKAGAKSVIVGTLATPYLDRSIDGPDDEIAERPS